MKKGNILFLSYIIILAILILSNCDHSIPEKPFETGGNMNTAKIILIGEEHGIGWILDKQIEKWRYYYANEGLRDIFIEVSFFTGHFFNLWMESDNDDILDSIFEDMHGTFGGTPAFYEFYKRIKQEFPETVFHGIDIGHQYSLTGERFLNYLIENGLQNTEQYNLTQEAIEQGRYYYDTLSLEYREYVMANNILRKFDNKGWHFYQNLSIEYRENAMASNFIREFDNIGNIKIMGIFGTSHTNFSRNISGNIPTMARLLKNHYGDIIYFENYRNSR